MKPLILLVLYPCLPGSAFIKAGFSRLPQLQLVLKTSTKIMFAFPQLCKSISTSLRFSLVHLQHLNVNRQPFFSARYGKIIFHYYLLTCKFIRFLSAKKAQSDEGELRINILTTPYKPRQVKQGIFLKEIICEISYSSFSFCTNLTFMQLSIAFYEFRHRDSCCGEN